MQAKEEDILRLLTTKSVMKQNIFHHTIEAFQLLHRVCEKMIDQLKEKVSSVDPRVTFFHKDFNIHSFQIKVAGDILQFDMHTNVFEFPENHPIRKHSRLIRDPDLGYAGIITVYNFMADSFKYNRTHDLGILAARIFVNKEKNILLETKYSSGYRMENFTEEPFQEGMFRQILLDLIYFVIEDDLPVPPFQNVMQVTVAEVQEKAGSTILRTGKRLGFSKGDDDSFFEDIKL
ncbi:MAG: hypothetical protein N3F09_10540 [Bacteroidia bacterium]|nr:hypothetical protein [Bacteroidia bacterium]